MRAIFVLVAVCTLTSTLFAQSTELRFDVVAIKPRGSGAPPPGVGDRVFPGGMFKDPATTLRELIGWVYADEIRAYGLERIVGLPKWAETALYSFTAKAGPDYPTVISPKQNEENVKAMIRSMLADRFQFKFHQEQRQDKVLVLQVQKGGAKLQPVPAPVPPEKEGFLSIALGDRGGGFSGKKITIAQLAATLSLFLKQRVVDRSGLTGFYDFNEKWTAPRREGDPLPAQTLGLDGLAQLVSVIGQDLGLVLKPETIPADFWVVDHVEVPSEN